MTKEHLKQTNCGSICVMPWIGLSVRSDGYMSACFETQHSDPTYLLGRDSIESFRRSEVITKLKQDLINGEKNPYCQACWDKEASGAISERQECNEKYNEQLDLILAKNLNYYPKVQDLDLQVGNKCNFACRMCNPFANSKLADSFEERKAISNEQVEYFKTNDQFKWDDTNSYWQRLLEVTDEVVNLKVWGGEPFINKDTYTFLEKLVEMNIASKIKIVIHTNGTYVTEKNLNLLNQFHPESMLLFSIEGKGRTNEYIRYPSKWDATEKQIDLFVDWKLKTKSQLIMGFCVTYQLMNMLDITSLYEFLETKMKPLNTETNYALNLVTSPESYSALNSPKNAADLAVLRVKKFLFKNLEKKNLVKSLKGILDFHKGYDEKNIDLKNFFKLTNSYDVSRGQKLEHYLPELHQLLTQEEKTRS